MTDTDDLVRAAQMRGMEVLFTIWGTPTWANDGAGPSHAPTDAKDLEDFAYAIASRYSGRYVGYPFVRFYTVWNEPNLPAFLSPQYDLGGNSVAPAIYARLYRAGYARDQGGEPARAGRARRHVAVGRRRRRLALARRVRAALSQLAPDLRFDAWAHHPYATEPDLPPSQRVRWPNVTLTQLPRFETALARWWHRRRVPIWITEYDYRTRPQRRAASPTPSRRDYLEDALGMADGRPERLDVRLVRPARRPAGAVAERARRPERPPQARLRGLRAGGAARSTRATPIARRRSRTSGPWVHVSRAGIWRGTTASARPSGCATGHGRARPARRAPPRRGARSASTSGSASGSRFRPKPGRYTVRLDGADVHGNRVAATLALVAR